MELFSCFLVGEGAITKLGVGKLSEAKPGTSKRLELLALLICPHVDPNVRLCSQLFQHYVDELSLVRLLESLFGDGELEVEYLVELGPLG